MEDPQIRVLYVDDEINNLTSFKANFRTFFEVYAAQSAEEGKQILKEKDIHVLITDQKMPKITGVQFLESIISEFPFPVRMILTGQTDMETVIEAINKGQVYRYLTKPFDADELKGIIENAHDLYQFRKNDGDTLNRFRQAFEYFNDAVFMMDLNGHFNELNTFGLNLFKIQRSHLNTLYLKSLFNQIADYDKLHKQLKEEGILIDFPARLKDTTGKIIESLVSATPIKDGNEIIGYQCLIRDITSQKETENLVLRAIIETQENERVRMGKNLHDSVGQKLAALKMFLEEMSIQNPELKESEVFKKSKETIAGTYDELKSICFNIMPKTLEVLGLKVAVKEFILQNQIKGAFEIEFNINENFPRLNSQLEIALFRIVQEFVNNSMRHSKAKKVNLTFRSSPTQAVITLKDNGEGFVLKKAFNGNGMGLKNIHSRVQSYNGILDINSNTNMGTEFVISLPLS
ncbi:MAG TPA: response regulator [Bacteroidia bacterium]|jgi:PAS domain S-box-containing protein|nr:response regulator [Bacteroidia bacterium]